MSDVQRCLKAEAGRLPEVTEDETQGHRVKEMVSSNGTVMIRLSVCSRTLKDRDRCEDMKENTRFALKL